MKKLFLLLWLLVLAGATSLQAQQETVYKTFVTAVTAVATTVTNATAGTILVLDQPVREARISVSVDGVAATTNGNFIVKLSTAGGTKGVTNSFDTADLSNIKITLSTVGAATAVTKSDRFNLAGVRYIRVGQMENTFAGAISNIVVTLDYPK